MPKNKFVQNNPFLLSISEISALRELVKNRQQTADGRHISLLLAINILKILE
jgi:hypothetical protein